MEIEALEPTSSAIVRGKLGRRPRAAVSDKIATLEAQLAAARAEAKEVAKARAAVVGAIVIEAMEGNPDFARSVVAQLKTKVRSARDKTVIADLLTKGG